MIRMRDIKIALTGGIATGKSTVAKMLTNLGSVVLDADLYARRAVEPGTQSWKALRDLLGPDYFSADDTLDRRKLREKIVREPEYRRKVESVIHPFILQAMWSEWEKQKQLRPNFPVFFDIPLLFEGRFERNFDKTVLVYAPAEIQVERLIARDGVDIEEARRTLSMQLPIESKKAVSDYVIDNSGSLDETRIQVERLWNALCTE